MKRYVEGLDRRQSFILPECVDDYVGADNPVRVIDAFVNELDLVQLGFARAEPAETGRPSYHPAVLLKLYLYGYLKPAKSRDYLSWASSGREAQFPVSSAISPTSASR